MMDDDKLSVGASTGRPTFRSSRRGPILSRDVAKRQGQITHLAFALLGGRDSALAFLNGDNTALGGRPLDVAMASDQGYNQVEQAIHLFASSNTGGGQ